MHLSGVPLVLYIARPLTRIVLQLQTCQYYVSHHIRSFPRIRQERPETLDVLDVSKDVPYADITHTLFRSISFQNSMTVGIHVQLDTEFS